MPKRNGAKLTMLSASGLAVVDDRCNAAGLGQAVFKLFDLLDWNKVIAFPGEDEHIALYALRHIFERISSKGFDSLEWTACTHHPHAILEGPF